MKHAGMDFPKLSAAVLGAAVVEWQAWAKEIAARVETADVLDSEDEGEHEE